MSKGMGGTLENPEEIAEPNREENRGITTRDPGQNPITNFHLRQPRDPGQNPIIVGKPPPLEAPKRDP